MSYAIGTTMTLTTNGKVEEWTKIDRTTWAVAGKPVGYEWTTNDIREAKSMIKWANREIKTLAKLVGTDADAQIAYDETMDQLESAMDDLRTLEILFPRS